MTDLGLLQAGQKNLECLVLFISTFFLYSTTEPSFGWKIHQDHPPSHPHPHKMRRKWALPQIWWWSELIFASVFGNLLVCWPSCPTHAHKNLLPNFISHLGFCSAILSPLFSGINLKQHFLTSVGMLPRVRGLKKWIAMDFCHKWLKIKMFGFISSFISKWWTAAACSTC